MCKSKHVFSKQATHEICQVLLQVLCPSPIVPNILPNEDEWTIQVYPECHSWSFQSIPIHSNSVLLIRVGLAGEYECFEHVKKLCVASSNKFHCCLTH